MLPAQQKPDEVRGGDGLDFAAQAAYGQAMDARQQPPLTPFLSIGAMPRCEAATQHCAASFEA
jgi:hypothetical protein